MAASPFCSGEHGSWNRDLESGVILFFFNINVVYSFASEACTVLAICWNVLVVLRRVRYFFPVICPRQLTPSWFVARLKSPGKWIVLIFLVLASGVLLPLHGRARGPGGHSGEDVQIRLPPTMSRQTPWRAKGEFSAGIGFDALFFTRENIVVTCFFYHCEPHLFLFLLRLYFPPKSRVASTIAY